MNTLLLTAVVVYAISAAFLLLVVLLVLAGLVFNVKYFTKNFRNITYSDLVRVCIHSIIPVLNTICAYRLMIVFIEDFLDVKVMK